MTRLGGTVSIFRTLSAALIGVNLLAQTPPIKAAPSASRTRGLGVGLGQEEHQGGRL